MSRLGGVQRSAPPRGKRPAGRDTALGAHASRPAGCRVRSSGLIARPEQESDENQQKQQPGDAEDEAREERHAERLQSAIGVA